jgi:hypothetical protein
VYVSVHLCDSCLLSPCTTAGFRLLSNAQSLDHRPVPCIVDVAKIVQQPSSTPDKLQKAPPGVVVLLMELKMLGQITDPVRQHSNLNLRRTGIAVMLPVSFDQIRLCVFQQGHIDSPPFSRLLPQVRGEDFLDRNPIDTLR